MLSILAWMPSIMKEKSSVQRLNAQNWIELIDMSVICAIIHCRSIYIHITNLFIQQEIDRNFGKCVNMLCE